MSRTISHYEILEKLGEGGMGVVYKARDIQLQRLVALKFLPPHIAEHPEEKARFIHEAQSASALNHTNVTTIYGIEESPEGMFIAMEYVEGRTLKQIIEEETLSIKKVLDIGIQMCEGIAMAHEKGVVHRDIKSDNVMVTPRGQVKIMDFGLAKLKGATKITQTGSTLGTASYMSPEQAQGEEVDQRSDIFSFAVVLYEMITGRLPFEGEHEAAVMYSIVNETPEPLARYKSDVPDELQGVVEKAMEKDRGMRYQHVDDLGADLRKLRKELESEALKEEVPETERSPSIAVLPFINMSADPEQEYFCDGMAEEIINALTHVENLHVVARTSAFSFKGMKVDIYEIGKKLKVEHVLEGSVRKAGNRLRITAQLVKVANGYQLWSDRYDREMEDIFAIQDEIALAIVQQLRVKLVRKAQAPFVKRYTENLEAYSLYLKGRYYWNQLTPEGWDKSLECYQEAIEVDPTYALAYAGLSIWHQSLAFWGDIPPSRAVPESQELAQKAIELDDTISDAHNSLAVGYAIYDWNWLAADREFKRTLELDPANALGWLNYAICLCTRRRFKEALDNARRAQKLDPLSSIINTWTSTISMYMGQYEESVKGLQEVIAKDPDFWQPHLWLSVTFMFRSDIKKAVSAAEKAVELSGGASIATAMLACFYSLSSRLQEADNLFRSLKDRSKHAYVPPTFFVWINLTRNEVDEAFRWLQKAAKEHDPWIWWYDLGPEALRADDARFDALLKKVGLVV